MDSKEAGMWWRANQETTLTFLGCALIWPEAWFEFLLFSVLWNEPLK